MNINEQTGHYDEDDSFSQLYQLGETIDSHISQSSDTQDGEFTPSQKRLHPLFLEFIAHKIPCSMDINTGLFKVSGFYKNGPMILKENTHGQLIAIDKKNNETSINSLEDLVFLNFQHWKASGGKNKNYSPLEKPWSDEFQSKGLVSRVVTFTPSE